MVIVIWALVQATLGLTWLIVESVLGWHESGVIHAHEVLWFILPPICAVGAMVQRRFRSEEPILYMQSVRTGLFTTIAGTIATLGIWALYVHFLDTEFLALHEASAVARAQAMGMHEQGVQQMAAAARAIFSVPAFYIVSTLLPCVAGALASFIAAVGLRRRLKQ